jgi:tetratricopeptide (TPR) repeat protein
VSEKKPVLRDVDSVGRLQNLQAALWSLVGGVLGGAFGAWQFGLLGFIIGAIAGTLIIYFAAVGLADKAGSAAASIYMTSGSSTPGPQQYSQGDALVEQGKLQAAIREYEQNIAQFHKDPEPRIRLARLYRDRLQQYEEAAQYFKQVVDMPELPAATRGAIARELVELFTGRMKAPTRALSILARLAEQQPNTTAGQWARAELASLKRMQSDIHDPGSP